MSLGHRTCFHTLYDEKKIWRKIAIQWIRVSNYSRLNILVYIILLHYWYFLLGLQKVFTYTVQNKECIRLTQTFCPYCNKVNIYNFNNFRSETLLIEMKEGSRKCFRIQKVSSNFRTEYLESFFLGKNSELNVIIGN